VRAGALASSLGQPNGQPVTDPLPARPRTGSLHHRWMAQTSLAARTANRPDIRNRRPGRVPVRRFHSRRTGIRGVSKLLIIRHLLVAMGGMGR
jgi:hypothetical protein